MGNQLRLSPAERWVAANRKPPDPNERPRTPRFLLVTSYYSGLQNSIEAERFDPVGMPAIAELWKGLQRAEIAFDHLLLDVASPVLRIIRRTVPGLHASFTVRQWNTRGRVRKALARLDRIRLVLQTLRTESYDLVYVDREHVVVGALVTALTSIPVALRLHGVATLPESLTAPGLNPARWIRRLAFRTRFRLILASEDGTPVNRFLNRYCHTGVPRRVWLNGVPAVAGHTVAESEADVPKSGGVATLLNVSRLADGKGNVLFIEAMRELAHRRGDFRALVVGDGPLSPELRARAQAVPQIEFVGEIPHPEVHRLYRTAEVFVSLNSLGNLNNTVLEALAAGSCVVAFGHDHETGRDESTERLMGPAICYVDREINASDLADVLDELLRSTAEREQYQRRALKVAARFLCPWNKRIDAEIELLVALACGQPLDRSAAAAPPDKGAS